MDGPLQPPAPLRPVPIYYRRPVELDLSLRAPAPTQGIFSSHRIADRVKDTPKSPSPSPPSQRPQGPAPVLTQQSSSPPPLCPARLIAPRSDVLAKPVEMKNSIPVISPVRDPDLRSMALYHTLLRQHPLYHQLVESFLTPTLPPLFCHPAAALCDRPFSLCASALPNAMSQRVNGLLMETRSGEGQKNQSEDQARSLHAPAPHQPHAQSSSSQPLLSEVLRASPGAALPQPLATHAVPQPLVTVTHSMPQSLMTHSVPKPMTHPPKSALPLSPEELVSQITPIPDPYQQYGYGRKLFPCPQCRYTTDRRNNLKRHMLTMHQVSAKMLECCGVLFRTKAALREHALIFHYHGYTCFYCGRRFCRKALLKRHLSVHNGQKEFICNVCDYATSHKSNLERHRRVHMRQDDDTPYPDGAPLREFQGESSGHHSDDEISVCSHDDDDVEIIVHDD